MYALLQFFWQLFLLKKGPQDLPASLPLLMALALANLFIGSINSVPLFGEFGVSFMANLTDILLTLTFLYVLLSLRKHSLRWLQTASSFLGIGVLHGLLMMGYQTPLEMVGAADVAALFSLVLAVWVHIALGSILRHAIDIPLGAGVILVLAYTMLAFSFVVSVYPIPVEAGFPAE